MNKLFGAATALALCAALLTGCRSNVSDNKNGKITEPTMMPETIATMPSTDTVPSMTTVPAPSTMPTQETTRPSEQPSNGTDTGSNSEMDGNTAGSGTKARPNRSMG